MKIAHKSFLDNEYAINMNITILNCFCMGLVSEKYVTKLILNSHDTLPLILFCVVNSTCVGSVFAKCATKIDIIVPDTSFLVIFVMKL